MLPTYFCEDASLVGALVREACAADSSRTINSRLARSTGSSASLAVHTRLWHRGQTVGSTFLSTLFVASLAALGAAGCGGGSHADDVGETGPPLTVVPTAVQEGNRHRTDDFSFALPKDWIPVASGMESSPGAELVLSSASVSPPGTGPSSLVVIVAYDVTPIADRYPWRARDWARTYTAALDGRNMTPVERTPVAGVSADRFGVRYDMNGAPVEADLYRVHRGNVVYIVQCQAEPRDEMMIRTGCDAIVASLRIDDS